MLYHNLVDFIVFSDITANILDRVRTPFHLKFHNFSMTSHDHFFQNP